MLSYRNHSKYILLFADVHDGVKYCKQDSIMIDKWLTANDNNDIFIWSEENYNKLNIVLNHYPIRNRSDYNKKIKQLENNRYSFIKGIVEISNLDNRFLIDDYAHCN